MWISTVTYDAGKLRSLDPNVFGPVIQSIRQKKVELQDLDGNGKAMSGFGAPNHFDEIAPDAATVIVKRAWNNESYAKQFVDYINDQPTFVSATVESHS